MTASAFSQQEYAIRLEWGAEGVAGLGVHCSALVIVDVLSYCTSVDIAIGRGGRVLPVRCHDERGIEEARRAGAIPAGVSRWTLRPSSLVELPAGTFLALWSPNGATLCGTAATLGVTVLAGCLRNADAVARAAASVAGDGAIGVVPAGERWGMNMAAASPNAGPLRPCVEDQLGAGAVVSALLDAGFGAASPEAELAAGSFRSAANRVGTLLAGCGSGRELAAAGHGGDVTLAARLNCSDVAPRLVGGVLR